MFTQTFILTRVSFTSKANIVMKRRHKPKSVNVNEQSGENKTDMIPTIRCAFVLLKNFSCVNCRRVESFSFDFFPSKNLSVAITNQQSYTRNVSKF